MKPEQTLAWMHDGTERPLAGLAAYLTGRPGPVLPAAPVLPAWV